MHVSKNIYIILENFDFPPRDVKKLGLYGNKQEDFSNQLVT